MATMTANLPFNMAVNEPSYSVQTASISPTLIVSQTPDNTVQYYYGNFILDGNGDLAAGTLTGFAEYMAIHIRDTPHGS